MVGQRRTPRFVEGEAGLERARLEAKQDDCPHCGRADTLVRHGLLYGYAAYGAGTLVRGRRLLCSNRHRRPGCGRTVAVLLATVIAGCVVSTRVVSTLVEAVVKGGAPSSTGNVPVHPRSRSRLWQRLQGAQHHLRTRLLALAPPPSSTHSEPIAQLWSHLRHVFAGASCLLASFQLRFQIGVFG
jgi:hypothetical protein